MAPIRFLTATEVLRIHYRVIKRYGTRAGVRDLTLLESAVARPQAGYGRFEAYPDLFAKAAVLVHSLVKNHPFFDANKRTAATSVAIFLKRNGYLLRPAAEQFKEFLKAVATDKLSEEEIAKWLKQNCQKT